MYIYHRIHKTIVSAILFQFSTVIQNGNIPWYFIPLNMCCCCSVAHSCPTLCNPVNYSTPGFLSFPIPWCLLKLMSIKVVVSSNQLLYHLYIYLSSSIIHFSFYLQCFPSSGSFLMRHLFTSGGQNIGASSSESVLPMNIQGLFPLELTDWFDLLAAQGTLKGLLRNWSSKTSVLQCWAFW